MQKVFSYQVADSIDLRLMKTVFKGELYYSDADELFYRTGDHRFVYIFKYGVVCFLNYTEEEIPAFLKTVSPCCNNFFDKTLSEEFLVETGAKEIKVGYNKIEVIKATVEILRIVMLNVSQSVALDYYYDQSVAMLNETNYHTSILEKKGSLDISGKRLKKYIGKTLLLKNRIAQNLYIFDSPPETWEDETLNKIDLEMKKTFDLQDRFRNIHEGLNIVRDNLDLFKDLLQYKHSTTLEWIVIILILIEVLHLLIINFFPGLQK
ncbi:MAG: hypothetical protein JWN76_230 [Chitinophagaceae bacterium]|nr:hypothetical protein [Chitinophagaceae bacterium]